MKKISVIIVIAAAIAVFSSFAGHRTILPVNNFTDSLKEEREKCISAILEKAGGKKNMSADSFFINLKTFTGDQRVKVSHLLAIMNYWGESLGVNCSYCHNTNKWESDEIKQKQIGRDMFALRLTVNRDILSKIQNLQSKTPRINCGTCHNGRPIPD